MIVRLAGYNLDKTQIDKLSDQEAATPETISASYARISRSDKSVTELREEAISEVAKARKSNRNIIFEMGHSSVAEHAVFNFDLIGVSRILTEIIQRSRLASFTEKSQRYVTFSDDYVIPQELVDQQSKKEYQLYVKEAYHGYYQIYTKLKDHLENIGFEGKKRELEGRAKEDARYVLPLSMQTQMGMTINARSLAILLRRLHSSNLAEARNLYCLILDSVRPVVPSLIRYTESDEFLRWSIAKLNISPKSTSKTSDNTKIVAATSDPDDLILAGMIFETTGDELENVIHQVRDLSYEDKYQIYQSLYKDMRSFHTLPRCFELVDFTIEATMSASCFAQFKRHRMCTIIKSDYTDGFIVPPLVEEADCADKLTELMRKAELMCEKLERIKVGLGAYARTNAHKCKVLMKANLREFHHFARLRSDSHAQWEIRELSQKITKLINKRAPLSSARMMGKDEFGEQFKNHNSGS